jgi:hypothetical protein
MILLLICRELKIIFLICFKLLNLFSILIIYLFIVINLIIFIIKHNSTEEEYNRLPSSLTNYITLTNLNKV